MENRRVLVIDDDTKVHEIYKDILAESAKQGEEANLDKEAARLFGEKLTSITPQRKSFEVTYATQGEEGIAGVKKALDEDRAYAVAFIDVRMPPGIDGVKTATEIRKIDSQIEIVIVTAYADKSLDEIVENVGMPERLLYIKKPFLKDEIWQLANALSIKWNLQEKERIYRASLEHLVNSISLIKNINLEDMIALLKCILQQVFVNLILNAQQAMPPKGVRFVWK